LAESGSFTSSIPMLRFVLVIASSLATAMAAPAYSAEPKVVDPHAETAKPVTTYARLTSFKEEPGGKLYVRLKLVPRAKLPFTVQAFRVRDRTLLEGLAEGSWVRFTAKHIDGENTLTSIRVAPECKRFQECD
jgi:Cu/Ag efflux protein CusF